MKPYSCQCFVLAHGSIQAFSHAVPYHSAPISLSGVHRRRRTGSEGLFSRRKPFLRGSTLIRGAHEVGKPRHRAEKRAQPVQAISGWPDTALEKAIDALQQLQALGRLAVKWARSQSYLLERWYVKAAASVLLVLGIITGAANVWCLGPINQQYIPKAVRQAEVVLDRKVSLGKVRWVAPSGLVGFGPLASVGPVSLGAGTAEKSSVEIPRVVVCVDPLQSLLQQKLILQLHADQAQVSLVQAGNFAWFGYPDDPEPSARNFLPGLAKGLEADIAQHLQPTGEGSIDSGQHLGGLAARLASKVAKAEARQGMAPAPESALNFRPAVGVELEVVSKDERDLIQGRAELEALLTQQRSAQAARVQSPPSTSIPQDSSQDIGAGTRRQLSKHRGSSSLEPAQQGLLAKRAEGQRERGHVSQPKASALRVQPTRPPFASISAGRPPNRPPGAAESDPSAIKAPEDTKHDADRGSGEAITLQEEQGSEQPVSTKPGQAVSGVDRDSKSDKPQHLLPSFHGPSFKGQHASGGAALQPLTADKSSADREGQQELAERLGLVKPADSFARALGPRPHRHTAKSTSSIGHSLSGAASESQDRTSVPTSRLQEATAAVAPSQTSRLFSSSRTNRKRRAAEMKPQILQISGAEAQKDASHEASGQDSSQVSWLRSPAGASRALQVTKDGPKDDMRHSQGLKVLLDDQARAKEAELQQEAASDRPDAADSRAQSVETDPVESTQQPTEGLKTSEKSSASVQQPAEAPEFSEGVHDNGIDSPHIEASPDSSYAPSRPQDSQHLSATEGIEKRSAQGPSKWRLHAPFRHRARSALHEDCIKEQELGRSSGLVESHEEKADAPAESAVTGIEDVQAEADDSVSQAEGVGADIQHEESGQGEAIADSGALAASGNTEDVADTGVDPSSVDSPHDPDKKPGWAAGLQKQVQDRAADVQASAQGLFAGFWERRGWSQGPKQDSTPSAELPRAVQDSQHDSTAALEDKVAEESSAAANAVPTGTSAEEGGPRQHFSLHRSHKQLFVSTADSAAVSASLAGTVEQALAASSQQRRPRRKVRLVPQAVLPEQGLRERPHQAMPSISTPTQPTPQLQQPGEGDLSDPAAAVNVEVPSTEEEEEPQQVPDADEHYPLVFREVDTFSTAEGTSIAEKELEPAPAAVQDPASFELMAISAPRLLGPASGDPRDTAEMTGAAEASEQSQTQHDTASEGQPEHLPSQSEAGAADSAYDPAAPEDGEEQARETAAASEESSEEQRAEQQAQAQTEPLQPTSAPAVSETQEATPGEVEVPGTAAPVAAEPKVEPAVAPEGGRSKAKHTWHSPSLSARYGELPYDEPRYKPRIPDADQGGLRAWAAKRISTTLSNVRPPQLALERMVIRNGDLWATLTGEAIPRHIQNVNLQMKLGRDYRTLTLDITGLAHERDAASDKCTMINSMAQRHLRDAPSAPIVNSFSEVPTVATPERSSSAQPESAFHVQLGRDRFEWEEQLQGVAKEAKESAADIPTVLSSSAFADSGDLDDPIQISITERQQGGAKRSWFGRAKKDQPKPARPTGGRVRVRVNVKEMGIKDRLADLDVTIWGENLHAPLIERLLELPMDIYGGRINGKLRVQSYDMDSWRFPVIKGRLRGHDLGFHFFDAPDDFSKTKLDLLFEGDRLYMHGAQGFFGAVPLTLTGDMDLNPETGQYRLSASVPYVEGNDLRRTLAIRPLPFPVGGGVRGVLHVTGPLETPVFSGTAVAMPPKAEDVAVMEESNAKETLQEFPRAAGAYDRMPFASGAAVWTLDTSTDIFLLHSFQAQPLSGGQLLGNGRMWVSPCGEVDPRAVKVRFEGRNLPTETLLKRYLPKGAPLPPMELGVASLAGTMEGSFLAPDMHLSWEAPEAAASGSVDLSRDSNSFTCRAPAVDVSASLLLKPAPIDAVKTVLTQAEATALAQPQIEGADIDCNFKGLDVLPLAAALDRGAAAKTQRLKLNGRTKFSVRLTPQQGPVEGAGKGRKQDTERPSAFSGDLSLDGLRVNQLKLSRNLTGSILLSNEQFQIRAKGMKPDEVLEVSLKLPFAPGASSEELSDKAKDGGKQSAAGRLQGTGGALLGKQRPGLGGLGTLLPRPRFTSPASPLLAPQNPAITDSQSGSTATDGGHFMLRCGNLLMSAEVNAKASQVECAVQGLLLDELELASLRGEVQEALLSLNLESRLGRAVVSIAGPRFSGLQGQSLSGAFRWERDVVRLERAVLQQANSRYEVQGEYVIPSVAAIPKSAAEMALMQGAGGQGAGPGTSSPFEQADGRWRVQVSVPTANMEEIIPAARLLSRATALTHSDYERAKGAFLSGMEASGLAAQEIGQQLEAAALAMRMAMEADANTGMEDSASSGNGAQQSTNKAAEKESKQSSQRSTLPGLQDLKGQWSGGVQAYGGGGGATNVDFNVRGQSWQWGDYALDQVVANGSCHSIEGIKLEELGLKTGEAKLLVRGNLLGAAQDASIILTDFPVAILQPMFRALPALEHAAPAVAASGASGGSSGGGALSGLAMPFVRGAHLRSHAARPYTFSNSPVNGLLYVRGTIGGSAAVPEGEVVVRLYDGAVGPTYLAQAQAQASLNAAQQLAFSADLAPAEAGRHSGHVRVSGSIPLRPPLPSPAGALLREAAGADNDAAAAESPEQLEVDVSVKDGGMMLVTALTPDLRWQSGAAELAMSVRGVKSSPQIEGRAHFSKAAMLCPWLKYPITNLGGSVHLSDGALMIEGLEAHVGRRGRIRVKGGLPLTADSSPAAVDAQLSAAAAQDGEAKVAGKEPAPAALLVDVHGLEMRVRNVYTGYLDAGLKLLNSLTAPSIGGDVRISRGVASLMPGGPSAPGSGGGGSSQMTGELGEMRARSRENDLVLKAFTVLTRKDALARQLSRLDVQQAGEPSLQPMALCLNGLKIHLGPELRAMFPVVLNMGISGDIELNGAADPDSLRVAGTIHLDGGEVNLVATQLVLDREHPNRVVFSPSRGLDPLLDLRLRGAQVQALIQGRASAWQQNLILTPTKGGAGDPRGATEAAEAARIFEGQLAGALVAEDGQLALSNLAASAAHGFMPKIQTQGQLGQARWRLVSAPSIPGLLSLDPSGDPTSLLSSLTMGTEVEVQFGRSLQAAMARKLRDSDIATQWTLNYQLNSKLRMQFNIASSSPYPRTLVFQYSSETTPPPLPR